MLRFKILKEIAKYFELDRIVCFLVFLFPVAAMSIRGWNAYIFTILAVISVATIFKKKEPLIPEEKTLFWILASAFGVFQLSSLVNGWDYDSTKALGVEIIFLLAIPLYLLVRRSKNSGKWLIWGIFAGSFILAGQTTYEVYYLNHLRAEGVYSPIIYGSFGVMYAFIIFTSRKVITSKPGLYILTTLSILLALYAAVLAGSRGAYVAIPILIALIVAMQYRNWRGGVFIIASILLMIVAYSHSSLLQSRVNQATTNVQNYFNSTDTVNSIAGGTSAGVRFEMWKAALLIFKENPALGVGRNHYKGNAKKFVEQGVVNPLVSKHGHAHNLYFDFLASNGLLGFVMVMLVFLYPIYLFITRYKDSGGTGVIGAVFITSYAIFSLFETAPLTMINFTTTYFLFLTVLFSWFIQKIRNN